MALNRAPIIENTYECPKCFHYTATKKTIKPQKITCTECGNIYDLYIEAPMPPFKWKGTGL